MNDWCLGPLLPLIQSYYGIEYKIAALALVAELVGAIIALPTVVLLTPRLGTNRMLLLANGCVILANVLAACRVPFAVFACAYFFVAAH